MADRVSVTEFGVEWTWVHEHMMFPHWRHGMVYVFEATSGMTDWIVSNDEGEVFKFVGPGARENAFQVAAMLTEGTT